jgi:hypothetical protein
VMVDHAGVSTGPVSDNWKVTVVVVIVICAVIAARPILRLTGLAAPRAGAQFGSYTIDERLSNVVGYVWLCVTVLIVCGLVFSHFDRKRRLYNLFDRLLVATFNFFRPRKNMRPD